MGSAPPRLALRTSRSQTRSMGLHRDAWALSCSKLSEERRWRRGACGSSLRALDGAASPSTAGASLSRRRALLSLDGGRFSPSSGRFSPSTAGASLSRWRALSKSAPDGCCCSDASLFADIFFAFPPTTRSTSVLTPIVQTPLDMSLSDTSGRMIVSPRPQEIAIASD